MEPRWDPCGTADEVIISVEIMFFIYTFAFYQVNSF